MSSVLRAGPDFFHMSLDTCFLGQLNRASQKLAHLVDHMTGQYSSPEHRVSPGVFRQRVATVGGTAGHPGVCGGRSMVTCQPGDARRSSESLAPGSLKATLRADPREADPGGLMAGGDGQMGRRTDAGRHAVGSGCSILYPCRTPGRRFRVGRAGRETGWAGGQEVVMGTLGRKNP